MPQYLTVGIFIVLACYAYYYTRDPKLAIEIVALAFFAGLGAILGGLAAAEHWAARPPAAAVRRLLRRVWLVPVCLLCGFFTATGGGIIRRSLELGFRDFAKYFDVYLLNCYNPTLTILVPFDYQGYPAIVAGFCVGTLVALTIIFWVPNIAPIQTQMSEVTFAADRLLSGFFAAYGIEAAMKFVSALPIPIAQGEQATLRFLGLVAALTFPSAFIMACGGGLLRGIAADVLLLRFPNLCATIRVWVVQSNLQTFGAIGFFGFVFYELLDRTPLAFGTCVQIRNVYMLATMGFCVLVAAVAFLRTPPPPVAGP